MTNIKNMLQSMQSMIFELEKQINIKSTNLKELTNTVESLKLQEKSLEEKST